MASWRDRTFRITGSCPLVTEVFPEQRVSNTASMIFFMLINADILTKSLVAGQVRRLYPQMP